MKASALIQAALKTHYIRGCADYSKGRNHSEYMCHAMRGYLLDNGLNPYADFVDHAVATFMPQIAEYDTGCLCVALKGMDKKYDRYARQYGHDSKACYKIRVQWWQAHIEKLQTMGK